MLNMRNRYYLQILFTFIFVKPLQILNFQLIFTITNRSIAQIRPNKSVKKPRLEFESGVVGKEEWRCRRIHLARYLWWSKITYMFFSKNGPTPASFSFIFSLFKQTLLQFLQQIYVKKCPSSIRWQLQNWA